MINKLNKTLASSALSMRVQSQRMGLLAENIANAQTVGYKAKDLDFKAIMGGSINHMQGLMMTNERHIGSRQANELGSLSYRIPTRSSAIDNTVEEEIEQAAFSEAALRYQTSLQFMNSSLRNLKLAIRGQ
jgi:flagellar basal-body rod protein FlgB